MVTALTNVIGERGEIIFDLALTEYKAFKRPLFKPGFLGAKWPNLDYYVELEGVPNSRPVFFAQVKATSQELHPASKILKIALPPAKCLGLFQVPGPTYVVGVHEPSHRTFIASVHRRPTKGIYSIPLANELTPANLRVLYNEVRSFWKSVPNKPRKSAFTV